jgi:7-carboxy-7-deazaguanine synthase
MTSDLQTTLKINEIYASLQGESTFAGQTCVFIRLTGCPLRCSWCDTTYAFQEGTELSLENILCTVRDYGIPLIEITGGEPLAQKNVYFLMQALLQQHYQVLLETSGALSLSQVPSEIIKIMDIKCPQSQEAHRNHLDNLHLLIPHQDQIKFVIQDETDYAYAQEQIKRYQLDERFTLLLSPVHELLPPQHLAEWMIRDHAPGKLQIQLHKYLWPHEIRRR